MGIYEEQKFKDFFDIMRKFRSIFKNNYLNSLPKIAEQVMDRYTDIKDKLSDPDFIEETFEKIVLDGPRMIKDELLNQGMMLYNYIYLKISHI